MLRFKGLNRPKYLLLVPSILWIAIFLILPISLVLIFSFFQRGDYGEIKYDFTLANFRLLFSDLYYKVICRTYGIALFNSVLCLIISYPLAWYIAGISNSKIKGTLLILIMLPFWTNFLARTFAWMLILGNNGIINSTLLNNHIIDEPLDLLFTPFSVQIGLLYNYLPFMVLPLYASLDKIDKQLYSAAKDLGANTWKLFLHITLPLSRSGINTGIFLVLIPTLGEFVVPDLLGGAKMSMVGNLIKDQFLTARNRPLGSALVCSTMAIILIIMAIRLFLLKEERRVHEK